MSSERPIIFSGDMVRAILDGRKTQTRRIIKPQPIQISNETPLIQKKDHKLIAVQKQNCPYGRVGDLLWVKEDYKYLIQGDLVITYYKYSIDKNRVRYTPLSCLDEKTQKKLIKGRQEVWKSKLLMFKFMARIWLEITNRRVEKVQDIDAVEAEAEGMRRPKRLCPDRHDEYILERFIRLWGSLNAKRGFSWDKNPWAWVIEFKRIDR